MNSSNDGNSLQECINCNAVTKRVYPWCKWCESCDKKLKADAPKFVFFAQAAGFMKQAHTITTLEKQVIVKDATIAGLTGLAEFYKKQTTTENKEKVEALADMIKAEISASEKDDTIAELCEELKANNAGVQTLMENKDKAIEILTIAMQTKSIETKKALSEKDEISGQLNSMTSRMVGKEKEIEKLRKELEALKANLEVLTTTLEKKNEELSDLKVDAATISHDEEKLREAEKKIEELNSLMTEKDTTIAELKNGKAAETKVASAKTSVETEKVREELMDLIKEKENTITKLDAEIKEKETNLEMEKNRAMDLRKALDAKEAEAKTLEEEKDQAISKLAKISMIEKELKELKTKDAEVQTSVKEKEKTIEQLRRRLELKDSEVLTSVEQKNKAISKLNELKKKDAQVQTSANEKISDLIQKLKTRDAQVQTLEEEKEGAISRINLEMAASKILRDDKKELDGKVMDAAYVINKKQERIDELEKDVHRIKEMKTEIESKNRRLQELKQEIQEKNLKLSTLFTNEEENVKELEHQDEAIEKLERKLQKKRDKITELEEVITEKTALIEAFRKRDSTTKRKRSQDDEGGGIKKGSGKKKKKKSVLAAEDKEKCMKILQAIIESDAKAGKYFGKPVDPKKLNIPTYFDVIKSPMDLGTLKQKMDNDEIVSVDEFLRLMNLIFTNAMTFNDSDTAVHIIAQSLQDKFNGLLKEFLPLSQTGASAADPTGGSRHEQQSPSLVKPKLRTKFFAEQYSIQDATEKENQVVNMSLKTEDGKQVEGYFLIGSKNGTNSRNAFFLNGNEKNELRCPFCGKYYNRKGFTMHCRSCKEKGNEKAKEN